MEPYFGLRKSFWKKAVSNFRVLACVMAVGHTRYMRDASRNIRYYHWVYIYLNSTNRTMDSTVTLFPVKTALIVKNKYVKKWIKQGRGFFFSI